MLEFLALVFHVTSPPFLHLAQARFTRSLYSGAIKPVRPNIIWSSSQILQNLFYLKNSY